MLWRCPPALLFTPCLSAAAAAASALLLLRLVLRLLRAVGKILTVGEDQEVAVIGTLFKDMKLKPSILDEYSKYPGFKQAVGGTSFCSDDDSLVLEDEGARMTLRSDCADLQADKVVTGESAEGHFTQHSTHSIHSTASFGCTREL